VRLTLKKAGEGKVKAKTSSQLRRGIVNPELTSPHYDDGGELEMEIIASRGRGFITTEDRGKEKEIGVIAIDAILRG